MYPSELAGVPYLRCKRILLKEPTIHPTLTVTQPLPPALVLPPGTDQRRALETLISDRDRVGQSWSELIESLLALGRTDIPLARLAEGHIDAVRILAQAHLPAQPGALYGVWASRSGQTGVRAASCPDGSLALTGVVRFASGAGLIDRALIPVWLDDERHQLLDLDVRDLPVDASVWHSTAMAASRTYEVRIELTAGPETVSDPGGTPPEPPVRLVGETGFYLQRPGFFPGGVGVAACWVGGAARVADLLHARHARPSPAQQIRLGRIRADLTVGTAAVRAAAALLDHVWNRSDVDWQMLATEARAVAAEAVRRIVAEARLTTGPAGLALDAALSAAIPDLELYALQQNSDGDAMLLGDPERRA